METDTNITNDEVTQEVPQEPISIEENIQNEETQENTLGDSQSFEEVSEPLTEDNENSETLLPSDTEENLQSDNMESLETENSENVLVDDTVSGSDVRTDSSSTTELIDYTEILQSIDSHLESLEEIQTTPFFEKPINDYTTTEGILLISFIVAVVFCLWVCMNRKE